MSRALIQAFGLLGLLGMSLVGRDAWAQDRSRPAQVVLDNIKSLSSESKESEAGFLHLSKPQFLARPMDNRPATTPSTTLSDSAFTDASDRAVGIIWLPAGVTDPRHGLELTMSSRIFERSAPFLRASEYRDLGAEDEERARDLGLTLGYYGFNVGAAVRSGQSFLDGEVEGVDVGLGYAIGDFATTLSVGEYRWGGISGLSRLSDNFYKVEFGASYNIGSVMRFSGGIQYLDFRRDLLLRQPDAQKLFLRGSIDF